MSSRPLILGVAGGSASGKTTVVDEIVSCMDTGDVSVIQHDSYYLDRSHLTSDQRLTVNYDHPDSLDTQLLVQHLRALREGHAVDVPEYDFATHTRRIETKRVEQNRLIMVEGILILADERLRPLLDIKVFVETDPDVRLARRIERDVSERGRTRQSVLEQYQTTVAPMHIEFVEPSKRHADLIIPGSGSCSDIVKPLVARLRSVLYTSSNYSR